MNRLKLFISLFVLAALTLSASAQNNKIRLLVRSDDMGSSHAANRSCVKVFTKGISRSVEVMVPCPWFMEAAQMLQANPGIDVGVHLTLTSEWDGIKWGPITPSPSLADADGNFLAGTGDWYNKAYKMEEVEAELRKQIEMAKRHIPNVTHISSHMGAADCKPELKALVKKLAKEYNLIYETQGLTRIPDFGWDKATSKDDKKDAFIRMLKSLKPGNTYLFVEHPANKTAEMKAVGNKGMTTVARDRHWVTEVFTSDQVKRTIKARGIELIDYTDIGVRGK
ncbi:MAG TPA: polysaccharide deacetylase family protein [Prolixibacteraceae bacterium]|nr:polysaccharide deacetylase family protein [Prolixibacteraceae bacterium]